MIELAGAITSRVVTALRRSGPVGRHRVLNEERPAWTPDELWMLHVCGDPNPWDSSITCTRRRHVDTQHTVQARQLAWTDACHFASDACTEPHAT